MNPEHSFAGKFLRKIKKIDTGQIESFLSQVLREKAFLEVILDSITEGVLVADRAMKVVFINEAARVLLGLNRTECVGRTLASLLRAPELKDLLAEFEEHLSSVRRRDVRLRGPEPRVYSVTIVPIENDDDIATHSVWIVSDRTEAARREQEKSQLDNMESLAVLTAGVAHEIKNPLNSLNIHAQLVQKAARDLEALHPDAAAADRLGKSSAVLIEEIDRLARVVDGFLRAVRPVAPRLRKESINKIVEDLAELLGPECGARGIELRLHLDSEIPPLLIDPEQLHQVFLNLAKNAMEAIDKPEGLIVLRTILKSDHALVEVEDNGCGIPEKDRARVFEPYHTTKFSGTGLGLMLVLRIVKAHRGAIALASQEGVGTVFRVALPVDERPVRLLSAESELVDIEVESGHSDPILTGSNDHEA